MSAVTLAGRTFLVATSEDRAALLARALRRLGGTAIPFPTVRIVPPESWGPLDAALRSWSTFDWVVFTSTHGVDSVVHRAKTIHANLRRYHGRIAAVGPATRERLVSAGLPVHAMPTEFLTDGIAPVLGDVRGERILLPRSRIARKSLAEDLRGRGAEVVEVDAYDAVPSRLRDTVLRRIPSVDTVLFTSASTAQNLSQLMPPDLLERLKAQARAACIGPIAADAAESLGFRVAIVAREHTLPGLVTSLTEAAARE